MVLHAANQLIGLCDTTPLMTSLNGRWHQQMYLLCWNPSQCAEIMVNIQMVSLFRHGPTVAASCWSSRVQILLLHGSDLNRTVLSPSAEANDAEDSKTMKYRSLVSLHRFTPIQVETVGALGDETSAFFSHHGCHIASVIAEPQFLIKRLSVAEPRFFQREEQFDCLDDDEVQKMTINDHTWLISCISTDLTRNEIQWRLVWITIDLTQTKLVGEVVRTRKTTALNFCSSQILGFYRWIL